MSKSPQFGDAVGRAALFALLAAAPAFGQSAAPVSLATVVDLAQRNSTTVRTAQADVEKARAVLSESRDVVIPSVTVGSGIPAFPEEGFTGQPPSLWSATVQSLAFSIPQKFYVDAARSGAKAATLRLSDAREQVALDASTAYIELDTVTRELDAARQQEGFAGRLVDIERQRTEAGVDPANDWLEARLTAAEIHLRRLHLEARAGTLAATLASLTGLPASTIATNHASIPEIPEVRAEEPARTLPGLESARSEAESREKAAKGDREVNYIPQLSFFAQYNRNTTILNNVNAYFAQNLPANNFFSGFNISIPLFDMVHRAKGRESTAEALRARVEAEQAERQNEVHIAELAGSIRELGTLAEIADLKQQIAGQQLKTVQAQLESGNGASGPHAPPQLTPKAEQQARIEQAQRSEEALDAGFELARARLSLLRALGHMQDWLNELHAPAVTPKVP